MTYVAFLFFLVGLFLAVFSLWSDGRSGRHRAMALAGVLLAWWAFCMVLVYGAETGREALTWYQLSLPGILFLIPSIYWIYFDQAGLRPWVKWTSVGSVAAFGAVLYGFYFGDGFYFTDFQPGPWGNVGVVSSRPFWYLLGSAVYLVTHTSVVVLMFRCRSRAPSARLRRLYTANAVGLIATAVVFGAAFVTETYFAWPPMDMIAAGFYLIGVNFYLMGRYRYLRRTPALDVNLIGGNLPEAFLVLDGSLQITTANPQAQALLGATAANAKGLSFPGLFDNADAVSARWQAALGRRETGLSLQVVRQGKTLDLNLAPHFDPFGDVCGAVAVLRPAAPEAALAPQTGLTARELEILDLVLAGHDNKTIAGTLFVSLGTVKNHLYRLYKKVKVESRLELMNKFRVP